MHWDFAVGSGIVQLIVTEPAPLLVFVSVVSGLTVMPLIVLVVAG
jgi:hypothetical protein